MSKRDLAFLTATTDNNLEPRSKRRRDTKSEEQDVTMADATSAAAEDEGDTGSAAPEQSKEEVKEQGLKLWHLVKDAVNKDGQTVSHEFLRLPSKRQYPDYYELIKRPMALDEIKKGLDHSTYDSLEQVKNDLGQCFNNAKKYNARDSPIWLAAKFLHKVTKTEYARLTGTKDEDAADGAEGEGADKINGEKGEGDGEKKGKVPNLYRQLKSKLQKIIDKADDDGRILSTLFMELPSKKDYPTYYKEIKKPQSLENIYKRLKRKEYHSSAEFAIEMELVFSNALAFNEEHSPVWEDAIELRDYYRKLMAELPEPFALPQYAKPPRPPNKIKLKMGAKPSPSEASPPGPSSAAQISAPSAGTLRVPGGNEPAKPSHSTNAKAHQQAAPVIVAPQAQAPASTSFVNQLPVAPMTSQTYSIQPIQTAAAPPRQQMPYQYTPHHYPNAAYQPPVNQSSTPQGTTSSLPAIEAQQPYVKSPSPSGQRHLKTVSLTTVPRGRSFKLDHSEGVRTWAMRLGQGEITVSVSDVRFQEEEEEQGSDEEMPDAEEEEEEEEEEPMPRNGKGKGKKGRGRPKANARATKTKVTRSSKPASAPPKSTTPVQLNISVTLNGTEVTGKEDHEGQWDTELRMGSNVLEVGEEGGVVWKMYLERISVS